jgi:hypothetical protein
VASIVFWLYARTASQLSIFHNRLDALQRYLLANSICKGLDGENKNKARAELIRNIARPQTASVGLSLTGVFVFVCLRQAASNPNTRTKHQNLAKRLARERAARIIAGGGHFSVRYHRPSANTDFGRARKVAKTHLT